MSDDRRIFAVYLHPRELVRQYRMRSGCSPETNGNVSRETSLRSRSCLGVLRRLDLWPNTIAVPEKRLALNSCHVEWHSPSKSGLLATEVPLKPTNRRFPNSDLVDRKASR